MRFLAAASLYTHQIAAFYILAIDVAWLVLPSAQPTRIRVRNLIFANMGVAVLYGPWVPIALDQVRWTATHFSAQPPDGNEFLRTLSALAGGKPYQLKDWLVPQGYTCTPEQVAGIVTVIALLAMGAPLLLERHSRSAAALLVVGLMPVLLIYLYSLLGRPAFMERMFIASTPAIALAAAMPLAGRGARWIAWPLVLAMLAINGTSTYAMMKLSHKEDFRGAQEYVAQLPANPRRLLVFVANEGQLAFDYYAPLRREAQLVDENRHPGGFFDLNPPQVLRQVKETADLGDLAQRLERRPLTKWS